MKQPRKYSFKDIACLLGISVAQVKTGQDRLGIKAARLPDISKRYVRFDADSVDRALIAKGLLRELSVPGHQSHS